RRVLPGRHPGLLSPRRARRRGHAYPLEAGVTPPRNPPTLRRVTELTDTVSCPPARSLVDERELIAKVRAGGGAAERALGDGYRMVFVMHDVEGYTHEEIGATLGIETGTSKAQLSRARAKLRDALADFAGEWIS